MPTDPLCDCGATSTVHDPGCARFDRPAVTDLAAQVAAEDGYPVSRAAIRHPSFARTRQHFQSSPFPAQLRRVS
ncbi:hypothetical protein ACFTWD_09280 [Streptomyces sp. NPDC056943]|uniref:hypothetical protein n=1 Tax=Streptomyces sp. NPDC056943 TaxID=3345971 RepID=UPI00363C2967